MIPDRTVIPGVKFTREFFKFLKMMIGENFDGEIPFFCNYYDDGKYAAEVTEDGWPILKDFDEDTYTFKLFIGPANEEGLHKLSVIQKPDDEVFKKNTLEIFDMTVGKGEFMAGLTAEEAYEYVTKKYKEHNEEWPRDIPWY